MFKQLRKRILNSRFLMTLIVEVIAAVLVQMVTCLF